MKKLLDIDPLTGLKTTFHYDPLNEVMGIEYEQPDDLYERNAKLRNEYNYGWSESRDMAHVASLGPVDVMNLIKAGLMDKRLKVTDERAFLRWLDEHKEVRVNDMGLARAKKDTRIIVK